MLPSFPPNSKLETSSGTNICPISSLLGLKHLIAFPALVQIFPSISDLNPSEKKGLKSYTNFWLDILSSLTSKTYKHLIFSPVSAI